MDVHHADATIAPMATCGVSVVKSKRGALTGGMPIWKYLANWVITNYMDCCLGRRHTEYHTGYRAYSRRLLESIDFHALMAGCSRTVGELPEKLPS